MSYGFGCFFKAKLMTVTQDHFEKEHLYYSMCALCMHTPWVSTSLSRTGFPVAEVVRAAELSLSLDLEATSFGHSTSSPMWHYDFNCIEKTRSLLWGVHEQELWNWREDLSLRWNSLDTAPPHEQTSASGQVSPGVCLRSWAYHKFFWVEVGW